MADQQGWALYYSAEGYPYYYNHASGESQWAQLGTITEQYAEFHASAPKDGVRWADQHQQQYQQNYPQPRQLSHQEDGLFYPPQPPHSEEYIGEEEIDESEESDKSEDSEESQESGDDDDNDDEEEQRSSVENKRWRAFLETPEGQRVLQSEIERIARKANVEGYRLSKKEREKLRRKEKAKTAETKGFSLDGIFMSIGGAVLSVLPGARKTSSSSSSTRKDLSLEKLASRADDEVSKHADASPDLESSSSSLSSDIDNDNDSVKSDDSDLAIINAPLIPEWLSLNNLVNIILRRNNTTSSSSKRPMTELSGIISVPDVQVLQQDSTTLVSNLTSVAIQTVQRVGQTVGLGLAAVGSVVLDRLETALKSIADSARERREPPPP